MTTSNKAIVGAIVTGLTALLAGGQDKLPWWLVLIIGAAVAGATVWLTPNAAPKPATGRHGKTDDQAGGHVGT